MRYQPLTDDKLPKGDPGDFPIAIPQQQAGETVEKRFADCTIADLEAAIRFAENPTDVPVPPEYTKRLDDLRNALEEVPNHSPSIVVSGGPEPGAYGGPAMRVTIKLPIGHLETLRRAGSGFPKNRRASENQSTAGRTSKGAKASDQACIHSRPCKPGRLGPAEKLPTPRPHHRSAALAHLRDLDARRLFRRI